MTDLFLKIINMSISATWLVLAVLALRLLLKKAPKWIHVLLWGMVALRLLCPFTLESALSLIPSAQVIPQEILLSPTPEIHTGIDAVNSVVNPIIAETFAPAPHASANPLQILMPIFAAIWCLGIAMMTLYTILTYTRLRRQVRMAIRVKDNIYLSEWIDTPFVLGLFRPRIYLPYHMDETDRRHVIAHERTHIRRRDHWWKPLGFLLLSIHWFNPILWLSYILLCRDIELACDERVIRTMSPSRRAAYSQALLNCSMDRRSIAACPLAFGEVGVRQRVKNVLHYKKPAFWITLIASLLCAVIAVCFLTDPESPFPNEFEQYFPNGEKAELLSGTNEEAYLDRAFSVTFRRSSGPLILDLELWYRQPDSPWTMGGTASLAISESCEFHIPPDCTFAIAATARDGQNGYGGFLISYPEGIVLDAFPHDFLTNANTKSADPAASAWTVPTQDAAPQPVPQSDWGVTIAPERVSRTGATAAFVYSGSVPGEEGAELTYGDFLSLERLTDGSWTSVPELPGYDYFVGDSSYPVVNGYGMVHEWPNRFGELPDGHYRLGKLVTLTRPDGSTEEQIIYGEFILPDAILTGPIPLSDLPETYSAEQAMIDGCLVLEDGVVRHNKEFFQEFAANSYNGIPSSLRIVNWHYGEDAHWSAMDLHYDGSSYTLTSAENTYTFRYLKHFTGEKAWEGAPHDAFDWYVLVNDDAVTWQDIASGAPDMGNWQDPAHWTVYADYIYLPKKPNIPTDLSQAALEFRGETLVTTTDFDRLEKLYLLFDSAELLGYEPKTYSVGVGLNLILTTKSGETFLIELDPDDDICRIDGEFVFYGAFDEPSYVLKLWDYLGLPAWPEVVYESCENALRP